MDDRVQQQTERIEYAVFTTRMDACAGFFRPPLLDLSHSSSVKFARIGNLLSGALGLFPQPTG
jgi:hypothetical protein